MKDTKIRITVEGLPAAGRDISLSEFAHIVDISRKLLVQAADIALGKKHGCEFLVSDLSHNSPACLEITAHSMHEMPGLHITDVLMEQVNALQFGDGDEIPVDAMRGFESLVVDHYDKGKIGGLKIESIADDKPAKLLLAANKNTVDAVKKARDKELVCRTSVVGRVELVNLHGGRMIKVFPRVKKWNPIAVSFGEEHKNEVILAIEKIAEIFGEGRYRRGSVLPYKMKMESIHILPHGDEPPQMSKLRGIAPDITGGKSVQEYMDDLRKEWD